MKSPKTILKIIIPALVLLLISSCKNTPANIPFPENETDFPQPVSKPLKFSAVKKLNWSNDVSPLKPVIKKFDFDKLPVTVYDTSAFVPFAHKPDTVKFDYDKLPDTAFDYNKLPSIPLKFETSVLEPPRLIQSGPPRLIEGNTNLISELGESAGLKCNFINSIFEDRAGFLWIATDNGLYRYDGENLLLYSHIRANFLIYNMVEDARGQIWMAIQNGSGNNKIDNLILIDPKAGIIKQVIISKGFVDNDGGIRMLLDDKGRIWVTAIHGEVNIIDENSGTIKQFTKRQGLSDNSSYAIIEDNKNNIWISTYRGINILDVKSGTDKYLNKISGLSTDSVWAMQMDNMNRVWLAGDSGKLISIDIQSGKKIQYYKIFSKKNRFNSTTSLLNDGNGNIWIGDYQVHGEPSNGTVIVDPANEKIKTLKTAEGHYPWIGQTILKDKHGQIWLTTKSGLNMMNRDGNDIQHIGGKDISSLLEDKNGKIWIGNVNTGIDILDPSTGLSRSFTVAHGLSNNFEEDMTEYDGKIFIITSGGIDIIDSSRKTIQHIGKSQGLKTDTVSRIIRDKQGFYWVAEYREAGLQILDLEKNIIHNIGIEQGLSDSSLHVINQDNQGRVWFISPSGAGIIDKKTNTIKYLNNLPGIPVVTRTDNDDISCLLEDKEGNMWMGTKNGINVISYNLTSYISFSTKEGLLSNGIRSLNKNNDQIYIGTVGGINILTPPNTEQKKWKIQSYGNAQGINKLVRTQNSDAITKNGQFLWGDRGVTILNNIAEDTIMPKTFISGIVVFNQPQSFLNNPWSYISKEDTLWSSAKDSFYLNGKLPALLSFINQNKIKWDSVTAYKMPVNLRLDYDENYLQFYFSQVNLGSVDTTWYKYILEGIDKNWSNKTANFYSENYLNLPPGDYTFKVCSEGSNGLWSKPAELNFTVLPPWWRTWWFYLVEAIAAIAFLYWIVRFYVARKMAKQKNELEKLKAVSAERERIASDMHDDLGAGLTTIRLLSEVANLKTLKESAAKSEIEKIVKSAHNLSENLREIIWTMNTKYDKLEDFIIYIRGYSVEFFDTSSIRFQFNKPAIIPDVTIPGELRRNIFLCIKEALNNIIKHSGATEAELSFDIKNNVLLTQIKDNGKGIDTIQINKYGNGLNGMKERLNKYGSNLKIEVKNGTSLQFEINI